MLCACVRVFCVWVGNFGEDGFIIDWRFSREVYRNLLMCFLGERGQFFMKIAEVGPSGSGDRMEKNV